jgi:hypothetical protein
MPYNGSFRQDRLAAQEERECGFEANLLSANDSRYHADHFLMIMIWTETFPQNSWQQQLTLPRTFCGVRATQTCSAAHHYHM